MYRIDITRMKSQLPMTDYAPSWNFAIGFVQWQNVEAIKKIENFLLRKEPEIIALHSTNNDGGTGLGLSSVTSRFGNYNLFQYVDECPELQDLLDFLRMAYINFVLEDRTDIKNINIVSWFNVIRKSQKIKIHNHSSACDAYLSGNMHIGEYETKTIYRNPYDISLAKEFPNVSGGLTLFPSCLPHYSTTFESEGTRISIAFDLHIEFGEPDTINVFPANPYTYGSSEYVRWQIQKNLKAIPFMSPDILANLTKGSNDVHSS